ncbi:hypothetical protein [Curtobacterium sp. MCPF17_052]|uniref:hypothetical protein n=1 Tax=Curtobacterium sp. MCPF17_052 TaxID=2175655 RepID=UPI0024DF35CB|nr:hypothetical protein [Curtobacterium sp. MCPF17_052]WIB13555.1 hypothetical protein DEJ36_07325 [Curtobacterium sp. MCPF17_052]
MAPVVLAVAAGMFGTMAVPAAFASTQPSTTAETARQSLVAAQSQEFDVSAAAGAADTSRDGFGATSTATLTAEKAAEHAKEVEAARAAAAAQYAYDGKTAEDYLATAKTGTANAAPHGDLGCGDGCHPGRRRYPVLAAGGRRHGEAVHRYALRLRRCHPGRLRLLRVRHVRVRPVRHQPGALGPAAGPGRHDDPRVRGAAR